MKRYIKFITAIIVSITLIVLLFLLLIRQNNSYITYIKLQVNPSFIIGINNDKVVVFYNALNEDANKYNLSMFQGKKIDEAAKVFIEKLGKSTDDKNEINLSIITKNKKLENDIFNDIEKEIKNYDENYKIIINEPTNEDLEKFSSEVVYNLKNSLTNEDLKEIGREINTSVRSYIDSQISKLNISKLNNLKKRQILEEKISDDYFNNYIISNIKLNKENIKISKRSNYKINFSFDDDNKYYYSINLNLEFDYTKKEDKTIIETYKYDYEQGEDVEYLRNLKNYYYSF